MAAAGFRLRRAERLRSSKDFRRLSRDGARRASRHFVVLMASPPDPSRDPAPRLGITVSRRVGNAVTRNRVKRAIREWFRGSRERLPAAGDLVVIARKGASELTGQEIRAELDGLFQ